MSNELSAVRGIGASISKSTGSLPTLKFKQAKKEKESTKATTTKDSTEEKPKKEKAAKAPKAPKTPKKEAKQEPIKVKSTVVASRPNRPSRSFAGELTAPPRELPGGQRWEEFKSYVEANKAGKMSPPVNLD